MGNIAFSNMFSNRFLAEVEVQTLVRRLRLCRNIDWFAAVVIAALVFVTMPRYPLGATIVGWFMVWFTIVDAINLTYITRGPNLRLTRWCVIVNAVLLGLTIARQVYTLYVQHALLVRLILIAVFSLLIANKAALLLMLLWFHWRINEANFADGVSSFHGHGGYASLNAAVEGKITTEEGTAGEFV